MTKHLHKFLICIVTALTIGSVCAAENDVEPAEADADSGAEELVLNQSGDDDSEETEATSQQGDDDFVPSAQISEDLSVSFPVDI
jgi:hypothetical protein